MQTRDELEVYERYGDSQVVFIEYSHGILTFAGLSPLKELALMVVIKDIPHDFTFSRDTWFELGQLPFSEVLVYNPDGELIKIYKGLQEKSDA